MKEDPKDKSRQDRLRFNREQRGWYQYGRIPYKIFYDLNCPDSSLVSEKHPGHYRLTPDSHGGEFSLSIFVHRSVPRSYKHIVTFHELREAELVLADNVPTHQAHEQVVKETEEYARQHLSPEEFQKFLVWNSGLDHPKNEGEDGTSE